MVDYTILNRMFTQSNLKELIQKSNSNIYNRVIEDFIMSKENLNNLDIIDEIYSIMKKNYRNEYFYQNTLVNKLLFGVHSPNTTTALSQIPINKSKADFILINGKATVFEIKTELDSFYRLESQLNDYYKAFKYVTVVTSSKQFKELNKILINTPVGINVITENETISRTLSKKPIEYKDKLDYRVIFNLLHKQEFENIILRYFENLPKVAPAFYYDKCYDLFKEIPMKDIQDNMLIEIKKRKSICIEEFKKVPYPLKAISYFSDINKKQTIDLIEFLKKKHYEEVI